MEAEMAYLLEEKTRKLENAEMREFCPAFFGLKNNCDTALGDCGKCWNEEVEE